MPTTNRYNLIAINTVYLTSTGVNTGKPCRTSVTGLEALKPSKDVQIVKALSGKPYLQLSDNLYGKEIAIGYESMADSVFDGINDEINDCLNGVTSSITLSVTGGPYGDFSLTVLPAENPIRFSGEFQGSRVKNGSFHFVTT